MKKIFTLIAVAVMALAAQANELTVCDNGVVGEDAWNPIPVYGYWFDAEGMTQQIYPAEMLTEMAGGKISSLTFYSAASWGEEYEDYAIAFSGGEILLSLKEVDQTAFDEADPMIGGATVVAHVVPSAGSLYLTFELEEPFEYNGGNLLVEVYWDGEGTWGNTYFIGEETEQNTAYFAYDYYGEWSERVLNVLNKVTFNYEAGEAPVEPSGQTAAPEIVTTPADDVYTITGQVKEGDPEAVVTLYVVNEDGEEVAVENPLVIPRVDEDQYVTIVAYAHIDGQNDGRTEIIVFIPKRIITGVDELISGKDVSSVRYYNLSGQEMAQPSGLTIMVTTYTDGTSSAVKVIK